MSEKGLENKKEKIRKNIDHFFKDSLKVYLAAIIAFGLAIRLYFLYVVRNQAHWWDSLAYGGLAKNYILQIWVNNSFILHEAIIRPPLIPFLWSLLIRVDLADVLSILLLQVIPSVLSILFIFLLGKKLYNTRVGLISAFILSTIWIHLFYSMRMMTDIPSMFFLLVSLYYFMESLDKFKTKYFFISILFLSLAVLTRYIYGLFGGIYLLFLIINYQLKFVKNRSFWIGGLMGSIPILVFFIFNLLSYGGLLPAAEVYTESAAEKPGFAFYTFGFIPYVLKTPLFIFFIIGTLMVLAELILGYDKIGKIPYLKSHLLNISILFSFLAFFIFILRASDDRYLIICLTSLIIVSSYSINYIYHNLSKKNKLLGKGLLIAVLFLIAFSNLSFGNEMINGKKESYLPMKDAFIWIRDNTPSDSVLIGDGIDPYAIFYSERQLTHWNFTDMAGSYKEADYAILHGFEHQSQESINYINNNTGSVFTPINVFFFDENKQMPAVVIYKINN